MTCRATRLRPAETQLGEPSIADFTTEGITIRFFRFNGRTPTRSTRLSRFASPNRSDRVEMVLQQMVIDVTRGRYPVVVDHLVLELLQMRDSHF